MNAKNLSIIFGISALLMVFSFVLVTHHHEVTSNAPQHRAPTAGLSE